MERTSISSIFSSAIISLTTFIIFLFLVKPTINSDDDFYILYTLAGGYNDIPTNILHYNYGWNPLLFWPVAKLFTSFPNFNWYTFLLLILQLISCINLLQVLAAMFRKSISIILFIIFFIFFESVFLISLNNSNTSFILAISGCSSLLLFFLNEKKLLLFNFKRLILPFFLLLISGLLRIHTLGLYVVLTLGIGLVLLPLLQYLKFISILFISGTVLFFFIQGQKFCYDLKISNFQAEEKLRESLFFLANHPINYSSEGAGTARVKESFIRSWFLYDTSFINSKDIEEFGKSRVYNRIFKLKENSSIIYWTFVNNKIYFFLFVNIFLAFFTSKFYKALGKWLLMSLPGILIYFCLALFFKVTEGILITIFCSIFISAIFCIRNITITKTPFVYYIICLLAIASIWRIAIIQKKNNLNIKNIHLTRSVLKELNDHENFLFINTNEFEDNGFYIWDTPKQYPLKNLITKELLVTNSYHSLLKRFKVNDVMKDLPEKRYVFTSGFNQPFFKDYYLLEQGLKVEVVKIPEFRYLEVYHIVKTVR